MLLAEPTVTICTVSLLLRVFQPSLCASRADFSGLVAKVRTSLSGINGLSFCTPHICKDRCKGRQLGNTHSISFGSSTSYNCNPFSVATFLSCQSFQVLPINSSQVVSNPTGPFHSPRPWS